MPCFLKHFATFHKLPDSKIKICSLWIVVFWFVIPCNIVSGYTNVKRNVAPPSSALKVEA